MLIIEKIAEKRIAEAIERGELDNLPGSGRPVELDDVSLIPEELRGAYRILKNAGYLPMDLQIHKEVCAVEELLRLLDEPGVRCRAAQRLSLLQTRLSERHGRYFDLAAERRYRERVLRSMDRRHGDSVENRETTGKILRFPDDGDAVER